MLLSPSQSINQYNFKLTNAKRWFNSVEFDQERKLSQKTYQDVLENLIYVPNLEKYASIQLQMLNYTQYVPSKFDANSTLNPNFLKVGLANSTNETIRNRLLILEKLVNVAIAQQSLLSGEPFVGQVDYLLNPSNAGTVAQNAVLKLLRNNTFFRLNYLKLSLRNMLTYTVNRKPNLKYTEQLNANLKAYADYINSGYQNCEIKGQQKNPNCDEVIYSGLSDHFKIIGKKIIITDKDRGDFSIDLPNAEYLSTNNFEHTAELKRLYSLRALIDSYVFKSKDFYNRAIDENYYVH
jgi:hypothetical protein